tara:strand:+ start:34489 stop:35016 length:528 start_codon:yes stop_codon:yes gene_type:complete
MITKHGEFLNVADTGVLITGDSGIGKSELALELIKRGHQLVADDIVELTKKDDKIVGHCPELLQDFLEVRGIGILNIRKMYGSKVITPTKNVELIIHFERYDSAIVMGVDRIDGDHSVETIHGIDIAKVTIPVAIGRNLAIILEAAVRNHQLLQQGYDAKEDFVGKQRRMLESKS